MSHRASPEPKSHRRPKRTVNATYLAQWANELSQLPQWLFEESYHVVGDLAETITLMLPPEYEPSAFSLTYWMDFIKDLEKKEIHEKKQKILWAWERLNESERFVFNKLITGGFRIGVSQQLMVKALAKYANVKESTVAHRLMGNCGLTFTPTVTTVTEKDPCGTIGSMPQRWGCGNLDFRHTRPCPSAGNGA